MELSKDQKRVLFRNSYGIACYESARLDQVYQLSLRLPKRNVAILEEILKRSEQDCIMKEMLERFYEVVLPFVLDSWSGISRVDAVFLRLLQEGRLVELMLQAKMAILKESLLEIRKTLALARSASPRYFNIQINKLGPAHRLSSAGENKWMELSKSMRASAAGHKVNIGVNLGTIDVMLELKLKEVGPFLEEAYVRNLSIQKIAFNALLDWSYLVEFNGALAGSNDIVGHLNIAWVHFCKNLSNFPGPDSETLRNIEELSAQFKRAASIQRRYEI